MAQDGPGHGRRLGRRSARVVPAAGPRRCRFGAARRIVATRGCEPGSGGRRMEPEYDAAVIEDEIAAKHDLRFVTWTGAATSAAFFLLVLVTTQVDSIQAVLPFTDDPYDAVTWFSVIAIAIVGGATIVRAIGHRSGPYDPAVARRIALGAAIVIVIVAIAVASDILAVVVVGLPRRDPAVPIVVALLVLAAGNALLGLAAIWRARGTLRHAPPRPDPEPDLIDEVGAIVEAVGARGLAARLGGWVDRSPLSPRRHRIVVGIVGALAAGVGAVVWHAFREGAWASPTAAMLFGGLMAIGVIGPYLVFLEPLRLVRPTRPD